MSKACPVTQNEINCQPMKSNLAEDQGTLKSSVKTNKQVQQSPSRLSNAVWSPLNVDSGEGQKK